jgi:hypothetical protein
MPLQASSLSLDLLAVIATFLPLLAVLLQFAVRFYLDKDVEGGKTPVALTAIAVFFVAMAGVQAGSVVSSRTTSEALEDGIVLLQLGFGLVAIAMFVIANDIIGAFGSGDGGKDTSTDGAKNEQSETADGENKNERG